MGGITKVTGRFAEVAAVLRQDMWDRSLLAPTRNPAAQLDTVQSIVCTLRNFWGFSNSVVSHNVSLPGLLQLAKKNVHMHPLVAEELERNIQEELGNNIPPEIRKRIEASIPYVMVDSPKHTDMFAFGFSELFGQNLHTWGVHPDAYAYQVIYPVTSYFIGEVRDTFKNPFQTSVACSAYAFEETAIPEAHVLDILLRRLHSLYNPKGLSFEGSVIHLFIEMHKAGEVEHSAALLKAISDSFNEGEAFQLRDTFSKMLVINERWWSGIAYTAKSDHPGCYIPDSSK